MLVKAWGRAQRQFDQELAAHQATVARLSKDMLLLRSELLRLRTQLHWAVPVSGPGVPDSQVVVPLPIQRSAVSSESRVMGRGHR